MSSSAYTVALNKTDNIRIDNLVFILVLQKKTIYKIYISIE